MKPDREIQEHVLSALDFEPALDASRVGVSVTDGVVTLTGVVPTPLEKQRAERITSQVHGVRGLASDLLIEVDPNATRSDSALTHAALNALDWHPEVPAGSVKISVSDGYVTLTGDVEWQFQRADAEYAINHLAGVRGVHNALVIRPRVRPHDVSIKIEDAFKRSAQIDAASVKVETPTIGEVILSGTVHTLGERAEAERAAWSVAGVTRLDDRIVVVP